MEDLLGYMLADNLLLQQTGIPVFNPSR